MKLKEFIEMLNEAAAYTKGSEVEKTSIAACMPSYDGIACQLYLTADGDVSAEQTGISISFKVSKP